MAFEIEFWIEEEKASIYLLQKDWSWVIFMPAQIRLTFPLFEGNYPHVLQLFFSHLRNVCVTLEAEMKQCNVLYDTASSFWWDVRFSRKSIYFHLIFFGSEETRVQLFLPHIGKAYPRRRELHKLRESFVILPPFLKFVPTEWLWLVRIPQPIKECICGCQKSKGCRSCCKNLMSPIKTHRKVYL